MKFWEFVVKYSTIFCVNLDELSLQFYKLEIAHKVGLEEIIMLLLIKTIKVGQFGIAYDWRGRLQSLYPSSKKKKNQKQSEKDKKFSCLCHVDNSSLNYSFFGISSNLFNLVYLWVQFKTNTTLFFFFFLYINPN